MANNNPTKLLKRGKKTKLRPGEPTITRSISLPESDWKKLDDIAGKLSVKEHCKVSAQEVIRRALRYKMSSIIQRIAEGNIIKGMSKLFQVYGYEIKAIPKYRRDEYMKS